MDFARRHREKFAGRTMEVTRLIGFCVLLRRTVLEQIGGTLDEQFGLGFFEDDDLGMRVRQMGLKLLLAKDVYIHHFYNQTFRVLGIDVQRQLSDNLERLSSKMGRRSGFCVQIPKHPAADRSSVLAKSEAPTTRLRLPVPPERPKISLCMIVRNEERNLHDCLDPLRGLVDEIIVVDTGSTDNTRTVARSLGAQVHELPWSDSFAVARNASIEHASGEWIFVIDADERMDDENLTKLKDLFAKLDESNSAYSMKQTSAAETVTAVDQIRVFRNDPRHRWKYRVHEQILPSIRKTGGEVEWTGIAVLHTGYNDSALLRRKLDRNFHLLRLEDKEHPDDPFHLFNLGSVLHEMKRPKDALPLFKRSLERSHEKDSIVRKLHALIARCHLDLRQPMDALQACAMGRAIYPDDAELLFLESAVLRECGESRAPKTLAPSN